MIPEDREVKMAGEDGKMSEPQAYSIDVPESYAEAVELYGESGAFSIFLSGLKVKQDNVARNAFKTGKTLEDVEKLVSEWKPGGNRQSKKAVATQLFLDKTMEVNSNPDLKLAVMEAFIANKWDDMIKLLKGQKPVTED